MRKSIHSDPQRVLQNLLRQVRKEAGLTQKQLAARLSTPHSRISDYERGGRRMDLVQFMVYCQALGIELGEFVDRFLRMCEAETAAETEEPASSGNKET